MIVDVHTHFFRPELDFGPSLRADMARCGVDATALGDVDERHLESTRDADVAVGFGLKARATGWNIPNDAVAADVVRAPERLLFFAMVDPAQRNCMEELERCQRDLGAVGVELAPLYQNVHPRDPRCCEIYGYCERHGLPVLFHAGTSFVAGTLLVPVIIGPLALDGRLGRVDGCVLLILFGAWMFLAKREARRQRDATGEVLGRRPAMLAAGSSLGGLLCLCAGGRLIVIGAEGVARAGGSPKFIIGATVVALWTSVPELATVVISQMRGHKEVGLGVILCSNIFNGLFIIPVAAMICPISAAGRGVVISLLVGLLAAAMTYPPSSAFIGRTRGILLLLISAADVAAVFLC